MSYVVCVTQSMDEQSLVDYTKSLIKTISTYTDAKICVRGDYSDPNLTCLAVALTIIENAGLMDHFSEYYKRNVFKEYSSFNDWVTCRQINSGTTLVVYRSTNYIMTFMHGRLLYLSLHNSWGASKFLQLGNEFAYYYNDLVHWTNGDIVKIKKTQLVQHMRKMKKTTNGKATGGDVDWTQFEDIDFMGLMLTYS